MSNTLEFALQKQTCQNKKIKVGLQIEQKINQIQRFFWKITNSLKDWSISTELDFAKNRWTTCGWHKTRFDSARLVQFLLKEILAQRCTTKLVRGNDANGNAVRRPWFGQGPYDKYIQMVWLSFTHTNQGM